VTTARDLLFEELERHDYPIREIETLSDSDDLVELAAVLLPTSADSAELDQMVDKLGRNPGVVSATWTVSTTS
jgi:putative Mg2+ transporter-C (MgtC) family protein